MDITRRKFFAAGTLTGAGLMLDPFRSFAVPANKIAAAPGFELLILATNWGFKGTLDEFCIKIKEEGYDGAEVWCPDSEEERRSLVDTFKKHELVYGFLVGGSDKNAEIHFQQFEESLRNAAALKPVYINCHSGRDFFSFSQNKRFIDLTTEINRSSNVPVYHETHRSRILYSAPVARQFIEKIPELRLTLDISHWCNVHESLLADQEDTVSMAIRRTSHIHARIGHPEGPQVNDPRAPEWKNAVKAHFIWWDRVVAGKKKEGTRLTILTEFGPINYMPALPYTQKPVANQWDINVHMLKTFRARYA